MRLRVAKPRSRELGQVIALTALFIVAMIGIGALVLDVARVYSLQRFERSVADAAALAGAQDLQEPGKRNVRASDYVAARADALALLYRELGGTGGIPICPLDSNMFIVDCAIPNTPYVVSIKTPSPSVVSVDAARAVQVTVRQPSVSLTFARLFGQAEWNVAITSVAGLDYSAQYAVVTLRGQKFSGSNEANADDINLGGGTRLVVSHGDVGSNTAVVMGGCGSGTELRLDEGYRVDHFDLVVPSGWCPPAPKAHRITTPIPDPMYMIPVPPVLPVPQPPTYDPASQGQDAAGCQVAVATAIANGYTIANWPSLAASFPLGLNGNPSTGNTVCYKPGIYDADINNRSNTTAILLEPGVYWFNAGLTMYGPMIAGYEFNSPGVSLVFPEGSQGTKCGGSGAGCNFAGNNSQLIAINQGSCIASSRIDCSDIAAPARMWDGSGWNGPPVAVQLVGPGGTLIEVPESIVVTKDPGCTVAPLAPLGCQDSKNNILSLPGGGSLFVAGVQYAPTDNVKVVGGSGGSGRFGQIIAWTLFYSGSSTLNQQFPGGTGNGILRLDAACSGPGTLCNP